MKLRNELTQKAIAKECAEWIRQKATFKTNVTQASMGGFINVHNDEAKYTYMPINGFTTVDGLFVACFDNNVPESVVREIAKRKPLRVVFKDSSFTGNPSKIYVSEIFKTLAHGTTVKVT